MMTSSDLKLICANYYKGPSFKLKKHIDTGLTKVTVCFWERKNTIIFYVYCLPIIQNISYDKLQQVNNKIKVNKLYNSISQQILPLLEQYIDVNLYFQYVFCGYSSGGSIASLLTYHIIRQHNYQYSYNLITFGKKPTGNKKYQMYMQNKCDVYNYYNYNDNLHIPSKYYLLPKIILNTGSHQWCNYYQNLNKGLLNNET